MIHPQTPERDLVWLARLLLEMTQERSLDAVLQKAIDALVALPGVALARISLLGPGDICPTCPQRQVCPDQTRCLHLAISGERFLHATAEEQQKFHEDYRRIPLGASVISQPVVTGTAVVGRKRDGERWIAEPALAEKEQICEYLHQPIIYKGTVLGIFSVFLRRELDEVGTALTQVIADHLGAALANARAFAEVEALKGQLELQNAYLREEIDTEGDFGGFIGESLAIRNTLEQIGLVAPTGATVLILGESGTGKELVAREIHKHSLRHQHALVKVNCAAIPRELYESEFFGHAKGAFTGALRDRAGRFEVADGGTLFLDEVGEIPALLQSKLLRVLQEGAYERVGEERTRRVDVRIIAATNRNLQKEVRAGRFREDLYYRLNVFPITMAPLRERKEDISALAAHFLDHACQRLHLPRPRLTETHILELGRYDWPGNIRELENVLERAVIMARRDGRLHFDLARDGDSASSHTPFPLEGHGTSRPRAVLSAAEIRQLERENIRAALDKTRGRVGGRGGAAELLGIKPTTLSARIKILGIRKPSA
jgi:formate hydrogenlyase transcriptional activator